MDNLWLDDVDDVNEVVRSCPDSEERDRSRSVTPEDGLNLPELEFTMNGSKNDDEEVDDEEEEEVEDEEDIQMDEEDCEDELEPQFKKKKTK